MKNSTKLFITLGLLFIYTYQYTYAQTNVSGGIFFNTTWTKTNSPYIVIDTVIVYPNVTLTIQPGVTVKFENNKQLEIRQASLIAVGTNTDSINFTSNSPSPTQGIWNAVFLNGGNEISKFNYCNFQFADNGIWDKSYDTLIIKNSDFKNNGVGLYGNYVSKTTEIDSCNFSENINAGISNVYAGLVNYCNISRCQTGLMVCGNTTLKNCVIDLNQTGINGYTLTLKNCIIDSNITGIISQFMFSIDSCIISHNQFGIIILNGSDNNIIKNSFIDSNIVAGISLTGNYNSILNCQITHNGTGVIDNGVRPYANVITRNNIENNYTGIKLENSQDNIYCNKICNNTTHALKYLATSNTNVSNNYWCTPDSASTASIIFDGNDTVNSGIVQFMPLDTINCYQCHSIIVSVSGTNPSCSTCQDGEVSVIASGGTPPYTYTWNTYPVQTTQTATGLSAGYYNVCVDDSIGCTDCNSVFISFSLLTNTIFNDAYFSIYPNPATDNIMIENQLQTVSLGQIKISNIQGQLIKTFASKDNKTNVDVSAFSNGIYIVEVKTEKGIVAGKFVKE